MKKKKLTRQSNIPGYGLTHKEKLKRSNIIKKVVDRIEEVSKGYFRIIFKK